MCISRGRTLRHTQGRLLFARAVDPHDRARSWLCFGQGEACGRLNITCRSEQRRSCGESAAAHAIDEDCGFHLQSQLAGHAFQPSLVMHDAASALATTKLRSQSLLSSCQSSQKPQRRNYILS